MAKLTGRLALVTGSSRGIGQQIALGLAREGADVIVHGRTLGNTEKTVAMLKPLGVKVYAVEGDLAKPGEVQRIIRTVIEQHGAVDILYNNAAIGSGSKPIHEHTQEDWDRVFQVNVWALIALCSGLVPPMKKRGWGRVINLSSGIQGQPNLAPYSVSKAAVDKYTRDLAADVAGSGVLVNYLDPGWLKTDLGGPSAMHEVTTVLPGALVPALLDDGGPNGKGFSAQEYRGK